MAVSRRWRLGAGLLACALVVCATGTEANDGLARAAGLPCEHGVLVDDNRRPLTEAALEPFRRQIYQYQSQLAAKGLPAGSPLALRLFS